MADKELILVRHAKSSWGDPGLADHDRPLNKRGEHNAPEMGQRLESHGVRPDAIFTSTAMRAATTADTIAGMIGFSADRIKRDRELYHADVADWLAWLAQLDDAWATVMAFGHNPGLTELVAGLWGLPILNVPTCGVVLLHFELKEWKNAAERKPTAALFDYPKNQLGSFEEIL